jgi:hypothetical protein
MTDQQNYYATRDQIRQDISATAAQGVVAAQNKCDRLINELNVNHARESTRIQGAKTIAEKDGQLSLVDSCSRTQAAVNEQRGQLEGNFRSAAQQEIGAVRATESRHLAEIDRTVQLHEQQRAAGAAVGDARSAAGAQRESQVIAAQTRELTEVRSAQRGQERTR